MIRSNLSKRSMLFARPALGLALALGVVAGGMAATPAMAQKDNKQKAPAAPKIKMTKAFEPVYGAMKKSWDEAKVRPDVVAAIAQVKTTASAVDTATTRSAQRTAEANFQAAQTALKGLVQPQISQFTAMAGQAADNNDKYAAGLIGLDMGLTMLDQQIQRQGIQLQLDSGFVEPARIPLYNYYVGKFAYNVKEYMPARAALEKAINGGYHDGEAGRFLAETYFAQNDAAGGLASLRNSLDLAAKAGKPVSIPALQRGLKVSSDAIIGDQAVWFGSALLKAQPNTPNWQSAFTAIRRAGKFEKSANLDLARLVDRIGAYENGADYMELIQIGTDLALPKEVLAVTAKGIAAGKLNASDIAVADPKRLAETRIKADTDTGLLRSYERDAALPTAKLATITGAADSFLSYQDPAKAEQFYKLALTKPGVDTATITTRLGIAQYDQGKYAEAAATFRQVTGTRGMIAALWAVQADLKAAPAPAAPAA